MELLYQNCHAKILVSLTEAYFWGFLCNNYLIPSRSSMQRVSYSQQHKNLSSSAIGWQVISQDFLQIQWLVVTSPAKSSIHYHSQSESKLRQQSLQFIFATPINVCIRWLPVTQFAILYRSQGGFSPMVPYIFSASPAESCIITLHLQMCNISIHPGTLLHRKIIQTCIET